MGLEGAGEGPHESGGSGGSSGGDHSRDRNDNRSFDSRTSATDTDYGSTWGGFFTEKGKLTEQTKERTKDLIKEHGINKVSAPLGGKIVEKNKGFTGALKGAFGGLFSGKPSGVISGAIEGYKSGSKEISFDVQDLDTDGQDSHDVFDRNDRSDFFGHNNSAVITNEHYGSIANTINPYVENQSVTNFDSLGPLTPYANSGDASTISPGSNLAVSDQDNSWLLIVGAALLLL